MNIPLRMLLDRLDRLGLIVDNWTMVEATLHEAYGVYIDDCVVTDEEEEDLL